MGVRHLTDDEIQAYLDGGNCDLDSDLKSRLNECRPCQNALKEYKMLYAELTDDIGFEVPSDLEKTVIMKLGLWSI